MKTYIKSFKFPPSLPTCVVRCVFLGACCCSGVGLPQYRTLPVPSIVHADRNSTSAMSSSNGEPKPQVLSRQNRTGLVSLNSLFRHDAFHAADPDMDLDNNPEFIQFLQTASSSTTMNDIQKEIQAQQERGIAYLTKATEFAISKIKSDATAGKVSGGVENEPPPTEIKEKCGKRSLRSSHVGKKGPAAAAKCAATEVKDSLYYLNLFNMSGGDVNVLPIDKVLVQVTDIDESSRSPKAFLVEPPKLPRGRRCRIGRGAAGEVKINEVTIPHDSEVSTKHGILTQSNKMYYFEDVGSSNGTTVVIHDKTVELEKNVPYPLENGAILLMGKSQLTINFAPL
jgi:FHA domain